MPRALLRLVGTDPADQPGQLGEVAVNRPECRANPFLIVGGEADRDRWAIHVEYQLEPNKRVLPGGFFSHAAFNAQRRLPVVLTAV